MDVVVVLLLFGGGVFLLNLFATTVMVGRLNQEIIFKNRDRLSLVASVVGFLLGLSAFLSVSAGGYQWAMGCSFSILAAMVVVIFAPLSHPSALRGFASRRLLIEAPPSGWRFLLAFFIISAIV